MTAVTFRTEGARLTGFSCRGHSGFAQAGEDIVCAAVTSAVRLTETVINEVLGLAATVRVREEEAFLSLRLPGGLSPETEETCQALLAGLMVYLAQLHEEYPAFVEVREEEAS